MLADTKRGSLIIRLFRVVHADSDFYDSACDVLTIYSEILHTVILNDIFR